MKSPAVQFVLRVLGLWVAVLALLAFADADNPYMRRRVPGAAFFSDIPYVWPDYVRLRMEVSVKLYEKGEEVGSATLNKGVRLKLLKVNADQTLDVSIAGFSCRVDHVATDFLESLKD